METAGQRTLGIAMKTLGTITPDRIKVISDEEARELKQPLKPVPETAKLSPAPTMTIEEEQDALEAEIERNNREIEYEVSKTEKEQARTGFIPDSIKAKTSWKIGLGAVMGAGGMLIMQFLKGC